MLVGTMSSMRCVPSDAAPPALSMIYAIGKHSYKILNLPFGDLESPGYENVPP